MSEIVTIDVETTSLEEGPGSVWDVAFKVGHGAVIEFQTAHDPSLVHPEAARVNRYHDLVLPEEERWDWADAKDWIETVMKGNYILGSNPDFDMRHLTAQGVRRTGHHRPIDISAYAMGAMGAKRPAGLMGVVRHLQARGFEITEPDHTAGADVQATYECFYALRGIYENRDW